MDKLINQVLFYMKIIFLLIAFTMTLYILFVKMDLYGLSIFSMLPLFIPLLLVLVMFVFSFFLNLGKNNMFFNVICILVLVSIILIDYRTLFDNNILSKTKINAYYFDLSTNRMKIMLYLTFISNVLLIIYDKKKKIHS